jgi:DNA-entry nuclease
MEAWSVEDGGDGICFNVYVFNVQPGSTINYATGVVTSTTKTAQTISDGTYSKTFKVSALKKKALSFKIGCSAQGKLTYSKKSGSKKLSVSKNGKVTVSKGTGKGTYTAKVKIKAAAKGSYKSKTVTKTITVTVTNSSDSASNETVTGNESETSTTYILNTNTKVFHYPTCSSVDQMSEKNKKAYNGTRSEAIALGYKPCGRCKP